MSLAGAYFISEAGIGIVLLFGLSFLVGGLFMIFAACVSWLSLGHWQKTIEKTPVVAEAAVVVDKRKVVRQTCTKSERKGGGTRTVTTMIVTWYATFEDKQGESQEYELFALNFSHGVREPEPEFPFYDKLTAGDAGVLYARDTVAFDFDKVC
ncbi:MAG: hypothetical protein VW875_07455 [Planctomycetaceae bacterium]